ncbi:MAG: hypothetical protein MI922_08010 [Bacteroidales bacterium]|nr:hypothetical protein [Bacteroidales bacterium]
MRFPAKIELKFLGMQFMSGIFASRYISGNIKYEGFDLRIGNLDFSEKGKEKIYGGNFIKNDKIGIITWDIGYFFSMGYKLKQYGFVFSYQAGLRNIDATFTEDDIIYSNNTVYFNTNNKHLIFSDLYKELNDSQYSKLNSSDVMIRNKSFNLSLIYYFGNQHYK